MKQKHDISLLRIIATLAVILLHTCSTLIDNPDKFTVNETQSLVMTFIRDAMRWSVPVFFMLTGILLLNKNKEITPQMCVKKYAFRMVLALLVFGIPFAMMQIFMETKKISVSMIGDSLLAVINDDGWKHLWYIYVLIGIYLMFPVIKKFTDNASESEFKFVMLGLFIFNFVTPFIDGICGTTIGVTLPVTYPVFYLFIGKYLSENTPKLFRKKSTTLICLIVIICGLLLIEIFIPSILGAVRSYSSPIIALIACIMYLLFKGISFSDETGSRLWKLDRICFGAYIVHPFFIHLFYKFFGLTPLSLSVWPVMIVVFFIGFAVMAFTASFILSLIKPLKKYIL